MSRGSHQAPKLAEVEAVAGRLIREAAERGEFDDLPGTGEPIPNLAASRDPDWWAKAWLERESIPPRLRHFAKVVRGTLSELSESSDQLAVANQLERINGTIALVQEAYPAFVVPGLDVDDMLKSWRRGQMRADYAVGLTS